MLDTIRFRIYIYIYIYIYINIDRIIRASIRLIYNSNRNEHLKTDENKHNIIGFYLESDANIVYFV